MTRLRYLKLVNSSYNEIISNELVQQLWTLTQLRGLQLSCYSEGLQSGISKLINLEELHINGCRSLHEDNDWFLDYNELLDLQNLTRLALRSVELNHLHSNIITKLTNLVELDLKGSHYDKAEFGAYSNLTKVTRLWFERILIDRSDPGLEFTQLPNLEILAIPPCKNVTQLGHLTKLRELYLGSGPEELRDLNFLTELTALQRLMIAADALPNDSIILDFAHLVNLNYLEIFLEEQTFNEKSNAIKGNNKLPCDVTFKLFRTFLKMDIANFDS